MPISSTTTLTALGPEPITALDEDGFWAAIDSPVVQRVLEAALECFARRGYHGTTTREIAQLSGLSPGGVYVHFSSKTDVLFLIALWGHHTSLNVVEQASIDLEGADHEARLRHIIGALVRWHVEHQDLARVIAYEQGALPEEQRATLRPFRRRFFEVTEGEITEGNDSGDFRVASPTETTRAILSLCTDIARWYRPGRGPGAEALSAAYADIAIRLVRE